jgi:hypothetical protein
MPGGLLKSGQIKVSRDARKPYSKQSECQLMVVGVSCCLLAEVAAVENDSVDLRDKLTAAIEDYMWGEPAPLKNGMMLPD